MLQLLQWSRGHRGYRGCTNTEYTTTVRDAVRAGYFQTTNHSAIVCGLDLYVLIMIAGALFLFLLRGAEIVPVKWHDTMFRHTLEGPDDMTGHVKVNGCMRVMRNMEPVLGRMDFLSEA